MIRNSICFIVFFLSLSFCINGQQSFWKSTNLSGIQKETFEDQFDDYQLFEVEEDQIISQILAAQDEFSRARKLEPIILSFPIEESMEKYELIHSSIMEEKLQAKYASFKTYILKGIDDPSKNGRLSITSNGIKVFIKGMSDSYFIERADKKEENNYIAYSRSKILNRTAIECLLDDSEEMKSMQGMNRSSGSFGDELRTYRLAVSTTGEYATFHGSTVAKAMAAIVEAINRLNVLYEQEISVRFVLVNDNDQLINLDPNSDPFNGSNASQMLGANGTFINSKIGAAAYDIGHVFATDGAGLASLASVCRLDKAEGVTGVFPPEGNTFVIEYLAHEIGHQFGASHTFNNCFGNEVPNTAYEPGSGTTVMSYAGLCGSNNVAPGASDYFHVVSLQQMDGYTQGSGGSCADKTPTDNSAPVVDAGEGGFFIPNGTPFELTAEGSDPDNDPISYCWEQYNTGPQSTLGSPIGNAPSFRSFPPTNTPTRTFPMLPAILDNNFNNSEVLSTGARDYTFQVTVRDNKAGGGSAAWDRILFKCSGSAGPFTVTSQNNSDELWITNNDATVTWDVAGTDGGDVNCSSVDIYLSKNLGFTFDVLLAEGVPNNGSATFRVPDGAESNFARVKVKAADNIFFNVNREAFKIETGMVAAQEIGPSNLVNVFPNPAIKKVYLDLSKITEGEIIELQLTSIHGNVLYQSKVNGPSTSLDIDHYPAGLYLLNIISENRIFTKRLIVE